MTKAKSLFISFNLFCMVNFGFAGTWSCPLPQMIESTNFIKAQKDPYDSTLWYLHSQPFIYKNRTWRVSYGRFFPAVHNAEQALQLGIEAFKQSPLLIKHPHPVKIPSGIFCDYMPSGESYFISALGE